MSSGEEERYISELFSVVASSVSVRLGDSQATLRCEVENPAAVTSVREQPTVGLHLSALLFTRSQALCARLAHSNGLPALLVDLLIRMPCPNVDSGSHLSDVANEPMDTADLSQRALLDASDSEKAFTDYYQILLLASVILDQYERSVQVRVTSSFLYTVISA